MASKKLNVILCPNCKKYQHFKGCLCMGCGTPCHIFDDGYGNKTAVAKTEEDLKAERREANQKYRNAYNNPTQSVFLLEERAKDVKALLEKNGWVTSYRLSEYIGCGYVTARTILRTMRVRGELEYFINQGDEFRFGIRTGAYVYYLPGHKPEKGSYSPIGSIVYNYLKENGPSTTTQINEALNLPRNSALNTLLKMERSGLVTCSVEQVGYGRWGTRKVWSISDLCRRS